MQLIGENRIAQSKCGLAWDRARASVMRGRGLAASAMARPGNVILNENTHNCKGNYNYLNLITNIYTSQSIFIRKYFNTLRTGDADLRF